MRTFETDEELKEYWAEFKKNRTKVKNQCAREIIKLLKDEYEKEDLKDISDYIKDEIIDLINTDYRQPTFDFETGMQETPQVRHKRLKKEAKEFRKLLK